MHAWRLAFGSMVLAVSVLSWLTHGGRGPAAQPLQARWAATAARCSAPAQDALVPLQAQALPSRTVVLVDAPVALALGAQTRETR